jgi:hypothetical protein
MTVCIWVRFRIEGARQGCSKYFTAVTPFMKRCELDVGAVNAYSWPKEYRKAAR